MWQSNPSHLMWNQITAFCGHSSYKASLSCESSGVISAWPEDSSVEKLSHRKCHPRQLSPLSLWPMSEEWAKYRENKHINFEPSKLHQHNRNTPSHQHILIQHTTTATISPCYISEWAEMFPEQGSLAHSQTNHIDTNAALPWKHFTCKALLHWKLGK